ncbi:MAG: DUF3127 domain-containing protein [Muribaculaceae bacterium]|nr:DUF3127 domain-containing protein [Muribaculaceae bacterium]
MEVRGKIIAKLPLQSGTSKAGNAWKKQEYVLETIEAYPRKVYFDFFGDRADQFPLEIGELIDLSFDIESREYNGRWYTSIRGWKAVKVDPNSPMAQPPQEPQGSAAPNGQTAQLGGVNETTFTQPAPEDDLPF